MSKKFKQSSPRTEKQLSAISLRLHWFLCFFNERRTTALKFRTRCTFGAIGNTFISKKRNLGDQLIISQQLNNSPTERRKVEKYQWTQLLVFIGWALVIFLT